MQTEPAANHLERPSIRELGPELLRIPAWRRLVGLALPLVWCTAYFIFAFHGWWVPAFFSLVSLSFVTYGSISHDLVHRNLGLGRTLNDVLLSGIELLALRSGHAYQAAHLHHHARYPALDDVEGAAARKSFLGTVAEGFVFQFRIYFWAWRNAPQTRRWILGEGLACVILVCLAGALAMVTPVFLVYVVLMVMGSWIIPLITSYIPHKPDGANELTQTRAFRGALASILALEHLYHLEHHLYPAVPHQNWPRLAKRLDPFFEKAGVKPVRLWF